MIADNSIETVLFDFDGTLVFNQPDSSDVLSAFCADIGQPLSPEAEWQGRRDRHKYFIDPTIGAQLAALGPGEFWPHFNRYLLHAVHVKGDLDQLAQALTAQISGLELSHICPQGGCDTLTELRTRGYTLGLITNRNDVDHFYELLDQVALRPYFDLVLASGEVGTRKPEPDIFYTALERIGTSAHESLYVGDNYWADVVGAERAGVTPVLLDPRRLFPEAGCLVLDRIDDLLEWLP